MLPTIFFAWTSLRNFHSFSHCCAHAFIEHYVCSFPGDSNAFIPLLYLFSCSIYKETSFTNLACGWFHLNFWLISQCRVLVYWKQNISGVRCMWKTRRNTSVRYGWGWGVKRHAVYNFLKNNKKCLYFKTPGLYYGVTAFLNVNMILKKLRLVNAS